MSTQAFEVNAESWLRVETLFEQAVALTGSDRADFLAEACGDDQDLYRYVEMLLVCDATDGHLIDHSIRDAVQDLIEPEESKGLVGELIGDFRVVRMLGSGGMGLVYLAERADHQYEQQVAIKVGRRRLVDPQTMKRLKAERQFLAELEHPNIARLLGGGTSDNDTPYLVMEYVDGLPVDQYCNDNGLSVDQRLHLFRKICSAVHYAHQNLIVHRDLKPSNILVTSDGTPKLLDFGIAKLLEPGGDETEGLTVEGARVYSAENAAPEQILGAPITTATDVYGLGALLYKLLTDVPPLRVSSTRPGQLEKIICQQEPRKPSTQVSASELRVGKDRRGCRIDLQTVSASRATSGDRLVRSLRGDLDNIVLMALRKEPGRRYRSANEFSEDVRRHLELLPVTARTDTWPYRTGKFVRRHTAGVAMATAMGVLILGFGVWVALLNQRVTLQRDIAGDVSAFLEAIFEEPDPYKARGKSVTARELLDRGARTIESDLTRRSEVKATLMETIGRVYGELGVFDSSVRMLEKSLALYREQPDTNHPGIASSLGSLGGSLIRTGELDRAKILLQEALQRNRAALGPQDPVIAANLHNLAIVSRAKGDLDQAMSLYRESAAMYRVLDGDHVEKIATVNSGLALSLQEKGYLGEAERLLRESIHITRTQLGDDHPALAGFSQNLAVLLHAMGEPELAEQMFYEAIELTRRFFGEEHDMLASAQVRLGYILRERRQYEDARRAFQSALEIHKKANGPRHAFVAYALLSLGLLLQDEMRFEESVPLLQDALAMFEEASGPDHQYTASALAAYAITLTELGAPGQAEPLLRRALVIRAPVYADDHYLVTGIRAALGHTLAKLGHHDEAQPLLIDSLEQLIENPGPQSPTTQRALGWAVEFLEGRGLAESAGRFRLLLASGT